jgi:hypothetical protein
MNAVDWTVAFERAARQGPHALVRALQAAVEHECTALAEKYGALLARQRTECDEILAQQRAGCDAILARQRADCDTILARQRAEFEQRFAALRRELLAKTANELSALRRELAVANAELERLRASPASEPARVLH